MSSRGSTVLVILALVLAMGALGYATWMNWKLQDSLLVLAETQERNLKEMMISLAHTEGQLGRVKEAVNAFDLQKWLATVQGPLVDRLEEKMSAAQREVVREEVTKWAQQITREQTEHWEVLSKSMAGAKAELAKQAAAAEQLKESLTTVWRDNEALAKKHQEGVEAQFRLVLQRSKGIQDRLNEAGGPTTKLQSNLEEIKEENQGFRKLLEERNAADREFQEQVKENLALFAEAMAKQEAMTEEQIEQAGKRWQGLFTTLRENHEAALQEERKTVRRLEESGVPPPKKVSELKPKPRQDRRRVTDKTAEDRNEPLGELMKFCARRPESVLCRDIEIK